MSRPNEKKKSIVNNLRENLKDAKSVILTDYRGMTVKQLEQLRKALKVVNAKLVVAKNTLLKISLGEKGEKLGEFLKEPTAVLISRDDEIAPLKEVFKFIKNIELPKIKVGIINNQILLATDIERLAKLPTREILLAQVVAGIKSPISGLVYALNGNIQKLAIVLNKIQNNKQINK